MNRPLSEDFAVLSRASVAELLHEMAKNLARLKGCPHLSSSQEEHASEAGLHIDAAVTEWIDDVMDDPMPSSRRKHRRDARMPEHPERALECILNMLAIYHDDLDEGDLTPLQLQRVTIAAHNLLMVVQEIEKGAH